MSSENTKPTLQKKTNVLGIGKLPESINISQIANGCMEFIKNVKAIRLAKPRDDGLRNAFIEFISSKHCENAKDIGKVMISGHEYLLNYARSNSQPFNVTASGDKLYVKYPADVQEADIIRLLGEVKITKPENSRNFLFATCKDIDQQCNLIKSLDNKKMGEGLLSVKVAIDKTKKKRSRREN